MTDKITIIKVNNGYICKWKEESENETGYIMDKQIVFEISDKYIEERLSELECLQKLFHFLTEHFGIYHDKYSSNLKIDIDDIDVKEEM
jgi:hypothetical protein